MSLFGNRARTLLGAGIVAVAAAAPAHAVLIAQEKFDYAPGTYTSVAPPPGPGNFNDLNGGTGWSTPFRSHIGAGLDIDIASGATGGYFDGTNTANPDFYRRDRIFQTATPSNVVGTTVWQSMTLAQDGSGVGSGFDARGGFQVNNSNGGGDYAVGINASGFYTLGTGHTNPNIAVSALTASTSTLLPDVILVKTVTTAAGQFTTSLWVNPNFAAGEAGLGAPTLTSSYAAFAGNANIGEINIRPGNSMSLDEISFGTAFSDVVLTLPPPPPAGKLIGLNFAGADNNPGGRKVIGSSVSAGAPGFVQQFWNNTPGTAQVGTPSSANDTLLNLTDSSGLPTTLDVTFTSPQTWGNNFGANPTGDQMLNGNGITDGTPTVTVSQIPFSQYDVVVYIGMYPPGRNGTYTLLADGVTQQRFAFAPDWALFDSTGYDLVSDAAISAGLREQGNYIIFHGLTASSFVLSSVGGAGISGIQIVNTFIAIPEPATAALLGLSVVGLVFRRNRRDVTA